MNPMIDPKTCCQICIVAKNLEKTAQMYSEIFGVPVPPIRKIRPVEEANTKYYKQPTATQARMCVFDMGQVCLEITEPDEYDSSWKKSLGEKEVAFHHIGFRIQDLEQSMDYFAKQGCEERHRGNYGAGYTYILPDTEEKYGVLFNLKYEPKQ